MTDAFVDTPKTVDLLHAKESFDRANAAFRRVVIAGTGDAWVPPHFVSAAGESPAVAMARKWGDIYKGDQPTDSLPEAGLLCGTGEVIERAMELNAAKDALKGVIVAMRSALKKPDQVREQLRTVGMLDYDLNKTYQRVLVLPYRINAISYTWTVGHRKVEPVTVKDLRRLACEQEEGIAQVILRDLSPYSDSTELARVKTRAIQLRANISQLVDGDWQRKALVTPGPIVLQQDSLPATKIWREKPLKDARENYIKPERMSRSDQVIGEDKVCSINNVNYFAYTAEPKTRKRKQPA